MNPLIYAYIATKLREPSTYAGLVLLISWFTGRTVPPEVAGVIQDAAMFFAGALLLLVNERHGPNPANAPLPPSGTAPVVAPALPEVKAVALPAQPAQSTEVKS